MELKVKEVGAVEEKSAVQVEEQLLEKAEANSSVLTFNYDTGERYLSVNDLF